jgi:hypothetical protein
MGYYEKKIKENAYLIATDLKCTIEIIEDDRESEYTKRCAKEVFFERVYEHVMGKGLES